VLDSDYGLLVILPDDVGQSTRSAIMSDVNIMAQQLGTEFDREHVSMSTWQIPGPADRVLVEHTKIYGIERNILTPRVAVLPAGQAREFAGCFGVRGGLPAGGFEDPDAEIERGGQG
jgi:hypothetical protein